MKQFSRNGEYPRNATKEAGQPAPESYFEPVHGWTRRQRDEYLARNPAYRPAYETELAKHDHASRYR